MTGWFEVTVRGGGPPVHEIPPALAAAAEVFEQWESVLADSLRAHGADAEQAAQLATAP